MRDLTVGQLRHMLVGVPDHLPVLAPAYDHSYRPASAFLCTAYYDSESCMWSEDPGYECSDLGTEVEVLVVE